MSPNHVFVDEKVSERGGNVMRVDVLFPNACMIVSVQHTICGTIAIFLHWDQFHLSIKTKLHRARPETSGGS